MLGSLCHGHTHLAMIYTDNHIFPLLTTGQLGSQKSTARKWSAKFKLFHLFQTEEQKKWRLRQINKRRKTCGLGPQQNYGVNIFVGKTASSQVGKRFPFKQKIHNEMFVSFFLLLSQYDLIC